MDVIDDAKAQMKKHAASALARKEELEKKLEELRAQRAELAENRAVAEAGGATELVAEIDEVAATLDANIESTDEQVALAANTVDDIVKQMNELEGDRSSLERDALVGRVRALSSSDPFSMDPADRALANVRDHAAQLDAEIAVEDQLSGKSRQELRRLQEEQKQADLRSQLEALKQKKRDAAAAKDEGGDDDGGVKKPKRTM